MKLVHLTVAVLLVTLFAVAPQGVRGQGTEKKDDDAVSCRPTRDKNHGGLTCDKNCNGSTCDKNCNGSTCDKKCNGSTCDKNCDGTACDKKQDDGQAKQQGCLVGRYGYGKAPICEKAKDNEPCPVHGYGPCPEEQLNLGLGLRQAFAPAERPYFGVQPLAQSLMQPRQIPYGIQPHGQPHGQYGVYPQQPLRGPHGMHPAPQQLPPGPHGAYPLAQQPRFPRMHAIFVQPPPQYMTTSPTPPMPTYTTRGPRDFFLDLDPRSSSAAPKVGFIGY